MIAVAVFLLALPLGLLFRQRTTANLGHVLRRRRDQRRLSDRSSVAAA